MVFGGGGGEGGKGNFSDCGGDTVVLSADCSSGGFRRYETDVVSRAELAKGEEETVDDCESGDVLRCCEELVAPGHDVSEGGLEDESGDETPFWTDDV